MNWRIRRFTSILVILTVTIFENVLSEGWSDQTNPYQADRDAGDALCLTPLITSSQILEARRRARVTSVFPSYESYAGFLTVNERTDTNLFFWFIPALFNATTAPVIVNLEGAPGRSSLWRIFHQHGPYYLKNASMVDIRCDVWNEKYNMIYIDSPAGTGFSFMNERGTYPTSQTDIARELLIALQQFFKLFYEFRRNDFYVAGESMGGKLVPVLTNEIHVYNRDAHPNDKINLDGMIIGNGFMDPENQLAYGKYLHTMGLIDGGTASQFERLEIRAKELIKHGRHNEAHDVVTELFALLTKKTGYCPAYDISGPAYHPDVWDFLDWLNSFDVRQALHVGTKPFTVLSSKTLESLRGDMTRSASEVFGQMLERYRALVYTGNFGIACPFSSVHQSLLQVHFGGRHLFRAAPRRQWRFTEPTWTVLAGYVKKWGYLYEVLVRNAAYFPSIDQPKWILDLLDKFTKHKLY